jgi:protein-S-isoprenylcysteine O-methyltransferase Ste14
MRHSQLLHAFVVVRKSSSTSATRRHNLALVVASSRSLFPAAELLFWSTSSWCDSLPVSVAVWTWYRTPTMAIWTLHQNAHHHDYHRCKPKDRGLLTPKATATRGTSKRDFLLFLLCLLACHWRGARALVISTNGTGIVSAKGLAILDKVRWFAIGLNCTAAWVLGRAYDRVTKPEALVTTGPYSIVRHPIYTSYLLLFGSSMITLGSWWAFAGLVVSAIVFYSGRMDAEDRILQEAFPDSWDEYTTRVPYRLFPWLL